MALKSASGIDYKKQIISIRIQELDKASSNGRPYEEDLVEESLCADSISDIPSVGDFLSLRVSVMKKAENGEPEITQETRVYKILTRYFSLDSMISEGYPMLCNLIVEHISNLDIIGKLIKD